MQNKTDVFCPENPFINKTCLLTEVRTVTCCDRVSIPKIRQDRILTGEQPELIGHRKVPILQDPVRRVNESKTEGQGAP